MLSQLLQPELHRLRSPERFKAISRVLVLRRVLACPRARSLRECAFLRYSRAFGVLKVERKAKIYFYPVFVPRCSTIMSYCNVLTPCLPCLSWERRGSCQMQNRSTTMAYTPVRGTILERFSAVFGTIVERRWNEFRPVRCTTS